MTKFIFMISFGFAILFAQNNTTQVLMYETHNHSLTLEDIQKEEIHFKKIPINIQFNKKDTTYWVQLKLGDDFNTSKNLISYGGMEYDIGTLKAQQIGEKFTFYGANYLVFNYNKSKDQSSYYFRLKPSYDGHVYTFLHIRPYKDFYKNIDRYAIFLFFSGLLIGLIFMAAIYNASMYYYNRDISFIHYAFMQIFIAIVLTFSTGVLFVISLDIANSRVLYEMASLFASMGATLFAISFLETKKYLPKIDKLLRMMLIFIAIDLIVTVMYVSLLLNYHVISLISLIYPIIGVIRLKQGFKPALYYVVGWSALVFSLILLDFFVQYMPFNPMLLGSAIEAILLSLALSYKVRMIHEEKEQQKELMVHQSKLASMGEMIGNIAHQWRQPLTHLSYIFMNIKEAQKHGELDEPYLSTKVDDATMQLEFMSQTIDDFKDFYTPNKEKEDFYLATASKETLELMKNTFKYSDIKVELDIKENSQVHNYKNEYKQVLLNLLSNAKDVLVERVTKTPKVTIIIDKNIVSIEDNAGGIKEDILKRIYEPYFTTKKGNSGIGLYMSKIIVERNIKGQLNVENTQDGARFNIVFNLN